MRRFLVLIMTFLLAFAASAMSSSPAVGTWMSIDGVDGSVQSLRITPSLQMRLHDDRATGACPVTESAAVATGRLEESGEDVVRGDVTVRCLSRETASPSAVEIVFTYDGADDTLTDDFGTIWRRS